jgi:hypothetical protein
MQTIPELSSLYVCMAIKKHVQSHIFSTDEDPGLRIESFAVINLRGVSTNKTIRYQNCWNNLLQDDAAKPHIKEPVG